MSPYCFVSLRASLVGLWLAVAVLLLSCDARSEEDLRIWKDATGKFQVEAVLLSQDDTHIVLRNRDGKEIQVAKSRLSENDRNYLQSLRESSMDATSEPTPETDDSAESSAPAARATPARNTPANADADAIRQRANEFFDDLRTTERTTAASMLTDAAQKLVEDKKSALLILPAPDPQSRAIRIGVPKIKGEQATVVCNLVVQKSARRSLLLWRKIDDQWRLLRMSAAGADEDSAIDFEKPVSAEEKPRDPASEWIGQNVEITGVTLDGRRVSLQDYRGKVVLIDFCATWCGNCIREMPNIFANYAKYNQAGFEVIAISLDDDLDDLRGFLTKENPPWQVVADRHPQNPESMSAKFGIRAIPTLLLIGPDGKVIDVNCRGPRLEAKLQTIFGR
ncbi:MAG: redoxin domain-containing protein [Pirellula sp.]